MKKVILSLMLLLSGMSAMAQNLLNQGEVAPNFALKTAEGAIYDLYNSVPGTYKVVYFWASWCPDCRKDMPILRLLVNKYWSSGCAFVGVSYDTNAEAWSKYYADTLKMVHMVQVRDEAKMAESVVAKGYKVGALPGIYLLDAQNKVVMASSDVNQLLYKLDELDRQGKLVNGADQTPDVLPSFRGGQKMLMEFLSRTVKYPAKAIKVAAQAKATITFMVNKEGKVTDITPTGYELISIGNKYYNSLSSEDQEDIKAAVREAFLAEAERVVSGMPKWTPGTKNGQPMSVKYNLPVSFRMRFGD